MKRKKAIRHRIEQRAAARKHARRRNRSSFRRSAKMFGSGQPIEMPCPISPADNLSGPVGAILKEAARKG